MPYVQLLISVNAMDFAIPFRSNITHPYVYWTDKENRCGLDFSKSVVIEKATYIDTEKKPYIRPLERKALFGKEWEVKSGLITYIEKYKSAKLSPNKHSKILLCRVLIFYFAIF